MKRQEAFVVILLGLTLISCMVPAFAQRDSAQQQREEQQNRERQAERERQAAEGQRQYRESMERQERERRTERERNEQQTNQRRREREDDDDRQAQQRRQGAAGSPSTAPAPAAGAGSRNPAAAASAARVPFEIFGVRFGVSTLDNVRRAVKARGATIIQDGGRPHILATTGAVAYKLPGLREVRYTFSTDDMTLTSVAVSRLGALQGGLFDLRIRELSSKYKLEKRLPNWAQFQGPGFQVSVSTNGTYVSEWYQERRLVR